MGTIPKIIHQIWSEKYQPLPSFCASLSETWKKEHPNWKYIFWNEEMISSFVDLVYPGLSKFYHSLPYDIQRWDAVRFLILYKMGGMYIDFDYGCVKNIEPLLDANCECSIATEPVPHCILYNVPNLLNSALIACIPHSLFIKKLIGRVFSENTLQYRCNDISYCILKTTGPLMISDVFEHLSPDEKNTVHLIPAKYVTPYDVNQAKQVRAGASNDELTACIKEAYAVHYFSYTWGTSC
jgi:mannosyltransferase OCH1-like enzyme